MWSSTPAANHLEGERGGQPRVSQCLEQGTLVGRLTGFFLFPRMPVCYAGIVKSSKAERVTGHNIHVLVPLLSPARPVLQITGA